MRFYAPAAGINTTRPMIHHVEHASEYENFEPVTPGDESPVGVSQYRSEPEERRNHIWPNKSEICLILSFSRINIAPLVDHGDI